MKISNQYFNTKVCDDAHLEGGHNLLLGTLLQKHLNLNFHVALAPTTNSTFASVNCQMTWEPHHPSKVRGESARYHHATEIKM